MCDIKTVKTLTSRFDVTIEDHRPSRKAVSIVMICSTSTTTPSSKHEADTLSTQKDTIEC
ncbi:hypothetical protein halTADL_1578 [Halohasta litchfieldiae]|jgi:hypothetical protein|uniref:Uncharacterized protein n=1 Tax=Halohasta litchfieldiae TaxID=1073996 RepID=A0A1H6X8P4_9EURY|nr:hypothetical protein halTADL_1578 [Halohasta litchfieldiae]SEJ25508.1 hypothetical protein SAMN05444271_13614 [Halohasta litchfieldiae]